MLLVLLFDFKE